MDKRTKDLIEELCNDLEEELKDRWVARDKYPSQLIKFNADMGVVKQARQLIKTTYQSERFFVFFYTVTQPTIGVGCTFVHTINNEFPEFSKVINKIQEEYCSLKHIYPVVSITGFQEFKSEKDYMSFKG